MIITAQYSKKPITVLPSLLFPLHKMKLGRATTSGRRETTPPRSKQEVSHKISDSVRKFNITTLKFDKNNPSNFAQLEKDLSIVGGIEFGYLFTHVKNGVYPKFEYPTLTDVDEHELHPLTISAVHTVQDFRFTIQDNLFGIFL